MNKLICIISFLALLGSACGSKGSSSTPPIFLLGDWNGKSEVVDGNKTYEIRHDLLFLPFHILIINVSPTNGEANSDLYSYRFVESDRVMIEGRLTDEFNVVIYGKALIINSVHGFPPDGRYTRGTALLRWLLLTICTVLVIAILLRKVKPRPSLMGKI